MVNCIGLEGNKARGLMTDIILKEEVYQIVGAALDVYWHLGRSFLEPVYHEAMEIELARRRISFQSQQLLTIFYKGQPLGTKYKPDMIIFDQIISEFKACDRLSGIDESQLLNYLKATNIRVGLLINFRSVAKLEWKPYVV
jgi:GxxExxY protein